MTAPRRLANRRPVRDTGQVVPIILFAAISLEALPERKSWYDCLDDYTQTEMLTAKTPVSIALTAAVACGKERDVFRLASYRSLRAAGSLQDGPTFMRMMAAEDQAAARHVIEMVTRNR